MQWLSKVNLVSTLNSLLDSLAGDEHEAERDEARSAEGGEEIAISPLTVTIADELAQQPQNFLASPREKGAALKKLTKAEERHAREILQKSTALSSVRYQLCPKRLNDLQFWRVYFAKLNEALAHREGYVLAGDQQSGGEHEGEPQDNQANVPALAQAPPSSMEKPRGASPRSQSNAQPPSRSTPPATSASIIAPDLLLPPHTRGLAGAPRTAFDTADPFFVDAWDTEIDAVLVGGKLSSDPSNNWREDKEGDVDAGWVNCDAEGGAFAGCSKDKEGQRHWLHTERDDLP